MADERPTGAEPPAAAEQARTVHTSRRRMDVGRILAIAIVVLVVAVAAMVFLGARNRLRPVPDVQMMTTAEAKSTIEAAGFSVGTETMVATGTVAPGRVIEQAPPGGAGAKRGSDINLTITEEPKTISMPDLIGMTGAEAKNAMEERQIKPVSVSVANDRVPIGEVFDQYPPPGSDAIQGEAGVIEVSSGSPGADAVTVPAVEETRMDDAVDTLKDAGLVPVDYYTNLVPEVAAGSVIRQVPAPGAIVYPGAEVVILVSASPN